MTDKEIEELSKSECSILLHSDKGYKGLSNIEFWQEGYKKGFAEGRKENWHNLEENPNDLPIYDKNVLVKYIIEDIECISISFCYEYNKWSQPLGLATDRDGYYYDYKILSWKEID